MEGGNSKYYILFWSEQTQEGKLINSPFPAFLNGTEIFCLHFKVKNKENFIAEKSQQPLGSEWRLELNFWTLPEALS
jgi:hypothetical protein